VTREKEGRKVDATVDSYFQHSPLKIPTSVERQREVRRKSDATLAGEEDKKSTFYYGHVTVDFSLGHQPLPSFWRYHTADSSVEKPSKRRVSRGLDDEELTFRCQHYPL
jgi:hypothetical protein